MVPERNPIQHAVESVLRRLKDAPPAASRDELDQVDLVFVVDATGSMHPFAEAARAQMTGMLSELTGAAALPVDLMVGLVEYRDHPPQERSFVARAHPMAADLAQVQSHIELIKPDGGGDVPEAVFDGLASAVTELDWRPHSHRLAVLVGDAPPHGAGGHGDAFPAGCPCGLNVLSTSALLEEQKITLYALGLTAGTRDSFRQLAHLTGGEYFDAGQGGAAVAQIRSVLAGEFGDLEFDRQVHAYCAQPGWSIDGLCAALASTRGRVSQSISRLGRRGLLGAP